jgi:predicted MFS family arabinose efflux permease
MRPVIQLYRAAFSGLPRDAWVLSAVLLVNRAGSMVLPFLTLYLTKSLGLSVSQAGGLISLYGLGAVAGAWAGGWLSDRIGSLRTQQLSLLISGVLFLGFLFIDTYYPLATLIFLLSLAAEAFRPAVMTAMAERAPGASQARCFALLRLAANLGMAVGPAAGGFLALFDYSWLFLADAFTCFAAGALLARGLRARPEDHAGHEDSRGEALRSPWTDLPFLGLLVLVFLIAVVIFQIFSTMPIYLHRAYGLREDGIGLVLALNGTLIVLFEMVLIHWAEGRDRMRMAGLGCFIFCAGLALMPLGSSAAFAAFTVVIWTTGEMLAMPLMNAAVAARTTPGTRGRYMGLYTMSFSVAFVVAPIVGTRVLEHLGGAALWYGIGALGPLLGLGGLLLAPAFRVRESSIAPGHAPVPE